MTRTPLRILVLTTSYPRAPDDGAGRFVADAVRRLEAAGVAVEVVSPASFRHLGIAYGHGIVGNLRARPWLVALLPLFLWRFWRAASRVDADLVHAHWIVSGVVALALRRPYVLQVWGTDVELAQRVPWLARPVLARARLVVGASSALAAAARELGARDVRIVPSGVDLPDEVVEPAEPPHVLYLGRLSPEKGVHEFLAATDGLPRVIVGGGPIDVAEAHESVGPAEVGGYYDRAAVVVVPSRREGYGLVAREAMAHGRPVVASRVGGLADAIEDGVDGFLVPPRDPVALRLSIERLLNDPGLRARIGSEARARARREWAWPAATAALLAAYEAAVP